MLVFIVLFWKTAADENLRSVHLNITVCSNSEKIDERMQLNSLIVVTMMSNYCFLPLDAMLARYMLLSCVRLSVCPFITCRYCTNTANISRKECCTIAQGL